MDSSPLITVEQFERILRKGDILSASQLRALQALYNCPNHSATAHQLAAVLEYKGFGGANFAIGSAGKRIANALGVHPQWQRPDGGPAWFTIIAAGEDTARGFLWIMHPELVTAFERTQLVNTEIGVQLLPDEEPVPFQAKEGARLQVEVNIYERSLAARKRCMAHYGATCTICGFDFEATYGEVGTGFIHVHHIIPLSEVDESYVVDPVRDLRPVCPNCHAMIHRRSPAFTIAEIRERLKP
jgi:predicted HNH restriction endonuclease